MNPPLNEQIEALEELSKHIADILQDDISLDWAEQESLRRARYNLAQRIDKLYLEIGHRAVHPAEQETIG
jgi:hypothetical protein